ncbi:helix-turn-helix domain-containing protein [Halobacterium rubrum]|uniref:helix-turn-helix domain-containing protein n=1 Tax=Halobacterium TaxID=2239 RepID=UPI001F16AA3A|nr:MULTISPECIES: helix-turn-helix domain-containing protein [Halobacterium]MDH5021099.1 helix-turn-helix domain-containing protein [Halobacterium rubrum]
MSVIVEFSVSSPRMNLYEATTGVPDVTIDVESVDVANGGDVKTMAWAAGGDLDTFDAAFREDPTTTDVTLLDDLPDRHLYSYRTADQAEVQLYTEWLDLGAAQLNCECQDGTWYLRVRFPDRKALTDFQGVCEREDVDFELQSIYGESGGSEPEPLTDAQTEALSVALEAGYLDVPRSAPLSAVADELDVSEQSASERLRRATKNLALDAVDGNG